MMAASRDPEPQRPVGLELLLLDQATRPGKSNLSLDDPLTTAGQIVDQYMRRAGQLDAAVGHAAGC